MQADVMAQGLRQTSTTPAYHPRENSRKRCAMTSALLILGRPALVLAFTPSWVKGRQKTKRKPPDSPFANSEQGMAIRDSQFAGRGEQESAPQLDGWTWGRLATSSSILISSQSQDPGRKILGWFGQGVLRNDRPGQTADSLHPVTAAVELAHRDTHQSLVSTRGAGRLWKVFHFAARMSPPVRRSGRWRCLGCII